MSNNIIENLEANIQEAKKLVEQGKSLERLKSNKDFRDVILKGYFQDEAIRLVHLKADPNMQTEERQKSILTQMDAIGSLNEYLQLVFHKADLAQKSINDDEQTREEILSELE